jgi:hypothetical protein
LFCWYQIWSQGLVLARQSATWGTSPVHFCFSYFCNRVSYFCSGPALGLPSSYLWLWQSCHHSQLIGWDEVSLFPQAGLKPVFPISHLLRSWDYRQLPLCLTSSLLFVCLFVDR